MCAAGTWTSARAATGELRVGTVTAAQVAHRPAFQPPRSENIPTTVSRPQTTAPSWPVTDATVRDLVPGLDTVAAVPIPYSQLPGRVTTAFRERYSIWSDIAGETMATLLALPGAGDRTVQAVLAAASEAVTAHAAAIDRGPLAAADAVSELLGRLDARDRTVLAEVYWAQEPISLAALADRHGLTSTWLHRHHRRAVARFTELLTHPACCDVAHHAAALAGVLGPYAPATAVAAALRRRRVDPSSPVALILLYAAGPYRRRGDWYENTAAGGHDRCEAAVDRVFASTPAPATADLTAALVQVGMPPGVVPAYVAGLPMRRFGDVVVRWSPHTTFNVEQVLHAMCEPATAEEIHAAVGAGTLTSVHRWLSASPLFVRTSRTRWALRVWGLPVYRGSVADEVGARIDAAGGRIETHLLIDDLQHDFPDVAESSIRTVLSLPAFVVKWGVARRRTPEDPPPTVAPLNTVRGALRGAAGSIRVAIPVTPLLLRGDGQSLRTPVATALGVGLGQHRDFHSALGPVPVSWPATSSTGPYCGTLRALALAAGAAVGDTLVLIFAPASAALEVTRIGADVAGAELLRQVTGQEELTASMLTAALDCAAEDVTKVLTSRGDSRWAAAAIDLPE